MRTELSNLLSSRWAAAVCLFLYCLLRSPSLPLSLALSPLYSLFLSLASLVLSLEAFRWHLSWRSFRFFSPLSEILVARLVLYLLCENEMKLFLPQVNRENSALRKVDSAIAANGSRNAASQVYRQTDRSESECEDHRDHRVEGR